MALIVLGAVVCSMAKVGGFQLITCRAVLFAMMLPPVTAFVGWSDIGAPDLHEPKCCDIGRVQLPTPTSSFS